MSAEIPDWSAMVLGDLDAELDVAMALILDEQERERRVAAFRQVTQSAEQLKQRSQKGLYFRTYPAEAFARDALVVWHTRATGRPAALRLVVSEEKSAPDYNGRVMESQEYVFRPLGNLIVARSCQLPVPGAGNWQFDEGAFLLQTSNDRSAAFVFHGPGFSQSFPTDRHHVDQFGLVERRQAAEKMGAILASLPIGDAVPVNYAYSMVST